MKKILFTAIMLVSFMMLSQAQQKGVGINTTTPNATLDIVANTADNRMADAILIPRMTVAELAAKDAAYTSPQNGALVFVTSGTGTGGKTENIAGTGFYYYNNSTSKWTAVGGGGASTPQRYETIRGTVTTVTNAYTVAANDYLIVTEATSGGVALTFPALTAADAGRTVLVFNNNPSNLGNAITGVQGQVGNNQQRGRTISWTGTAWVSIGL